MHLLPPLYFSYGQFAVFDRRITPGCLWGQVHTDQGFARRPSAVSFRTLADFGHARVTVAVGPYTARPAHARVIAVPFTVIAGAVVVEGPEELRTGRAVALPPGPYRLVAAQQLVGDEEEMIDLFFEPLEELPPASAILVADDQLSPPPVLLEHAEVA